WLCPISARTNPRFLPVNALADPARHSSPSSGHRLTPLPPGKSLIAGRPSHRPAIPSSPHRKQGTKTMIKTILCTAALAAVFATGAKADDSSGAKVTMVYDHQLPNVPGKSMRAVLVEYGPGGSSPSHTH